MTAPLPGAKIKFPRSEAIDVAREIVEALKPVCHKLIVAGSLRRRKQEVGDVEILYIPMLSEVADGLFDKRSVNEADEAIISLLRCGIIHPRVNCRGTISWGLKNKYARHRASGIPVDLFMATERNWFNYLVCRTGSAESNIRLASSAQKKGWKWHPYRDGFTNESGDLVRAESEHQVFSLAGLPYLEPWKR